MQSNEINQLINLFKMQKQVTQMSQNIQMAIKQEPVEWSDFEHEPSNLNKSSIEVAVKPELIYAKGDTDEEGIHTNFTFFQTI